MIRHKCDVPENFGRVKMPRSGKFMKKSKRRVPEKAQKRGDPES
jgi:hypothetical protein